MSNTVEGGSAGISGGAENALKYHPSLDGFRGFGVIAVLIGHVGQHSGAYTIAKGAVFAISMFFALSGYLITGLLLAQRELLGKFDPIDFWSRRFRRLMPVAFLGILLATTFVAVAGTGIQRANYRGDVLSSLGYVANWRFAINGANYADQFGSPSPLLHYWTLAIEEQFYLVFPLLLIALFKIGRGSFRFAGAVLGLLYAASAVAVFVEWDLGYSPSRVYFGTETRAAELLLGSVAAILVYRGFVPKTIRGVKALTSVAIVACLAEVYLWFFVDPQKNSILIPGAFPLHVILGIVIFIGAIQPGTILYRVLSIKPLVRAGKLSYGAYVFQWPIILWLSPERLGLSVWVLLPVYFLLTFTLSHYVDKYVERPIRRGQWLTSRQAWMSFVAAIAVLGGLSVLISARAPERPFDFEQDAKDLDSLIAENQSTEGLRVAFMGDSTAQSLAVGTIAAMTSHDELVPAGIVSKYGCGVTGATEFLDYGGYTRRVECAEWEKEWIDEIAIARPDVVVIAEVTDISGKKIPGDVGFSAPGMPEHDDAIRSGIERAVEIATSGGATVVWVISPQVLVEHPEHRPERMERLNDIVAEVAASREDVRLVDLGEWLRAQPGGEASREMRPDLVHFTGNGSKEAAEDLIVPVLLDEARQRE